jgi:predicted glutamine amidotransferase
MTHCFAFLCSDSALVPTAQAAFREALTIAEGAPYGWGLAYYQAGQPLVRKNPRPHEGALDLIKECQGINSNIMLGQLRDASERRKTGENTPPFRFRHWSGVFCGQLDLGEQGRDALMKAIPDHIQRALKGKEPGEVAFHLYLAFLNDTGRLKDRAIPIDAASKALSSTIHYLDRVVTAANGTLGDHVFLVSNGVLVLGAHRGMPLGIAKKSSYDKVATTPEGKPISYPHLRALMVLGGAKGDAPGWETVEGGSVLAITPELDIELSDMAE